MTAVWLGYFESLIALTLIVAGPLGAHFGWAQPLFGMQLFIFGLLFGLVTLVLGVVACFQTRKPALAAGRPRALLALAVGLGAAAIAIVVAVIVSATAYPSIDDLSTDPVNPPALGPTPSQAANQSRNLTGDTAAMLAARQHRLYPELRSLRVAMPPDALFAQVRAAAAAMPGWTITAIDPGRRTLQGVAVSPVFRFRDDLAIAVREEQGASVVEMRSKARDPIADLGANYKNISSFFARLAGHAAHPA